MQCIYKCGFTIREYVEGEGHEQVVPDRCCASCGRREGQHRHGTYERAVVDEEGRGWTIRVARFLCMACGRTLSYLPGFALSYRLVAAAGFEAFLEGKHDRRDVLRHLDLLKSYRRKMESFAASVYRVVGYGLGLAPPARPREVWRWLKEACGGVEPATCRLVAQFRLTVFGRYRCHQPGQEAINPTFRQD